MGRSVTFPREGKKATRDRRRGGRGGETEERGIGGERKTDVTVTTTASRDEYTVGDFRQQRITWK